jgi:chromosome segregation ATPase
MLTNTLILLTTLTHFSDLTAAAQGLDSVKQLVEAGDYPGVYGPLIDLIDVEEQVKGEA